MNAGVVVAIEPTDCGAVRLVLHLTGEPPSRRVLFVESPPTNLRRLLGHTLTSDGDALFVGSPACGGRKVGERFGRSSCVLYFTALGQLEEPTDA